MRLLLAEDERALSNALVTILKHNNYSVDAVYNGQDAIDYLESEVYDAAILDIMMPKADGITVLKTIRAAGNTIPVLLLTAKSEIDDKVTGLDCGADDYLTKPFVTKELLARIRAITRRQTELTDNSLFFGDLRLDRVSFELVSPSGKLLLTAKEFQIMEMFMKNPSQIISSERFMEKIWGFDSNAEINVVWTYISYLRKKLKILGSSVGIKAVRNIGYTLENKNA
ncbi:MAG: response regulator transcription factor [Clostridia bacterium]|nr:response regulator transcription factor [Clostridia bacterium]MDY3785518.1 response regulator transcription factor [Eubacteriales bacterium]